MLLYVVQNWLLLNIYVLFASICLFVANCLKILLQILSQILTILVGPRANLTSLAYYSAWIS